MSLRNFVPPRGATSPAVTGPASPARPHAASGRAPSHPHLYNVVLLVIVVCLSMVAVYISVTRSHNPDSALPHEWRLHLVSSPSAVCLDGSKPGYYIREGAGPGRRRWLIHLQGGGWCRSPDECLKRAQGFNPWKQPSLGGSGTWPARAVCPDSAAPPCVGDGGDHGLLSADPDVNPDWADANAVYVAYCDGGSFAGALSSPLIVEGTPIFLRGQAVLDAVFADLTPRLAAAGGASEVLLKGASAGGQALLIHANALAARLQAAPGSPRVSLLVDAGLFLDTAALGGTNTMRPFTEGWVSLHNATGSLPESCTRQPPAGLSPPHCALSPLLLAAVDPALPLFVSQFAADSAQLSWVMGLRCSPTLPMSLPPPVPVGANPCNQRKVDYLNAFRARMLEALAPVLRSRSPLHGAWIAECGLHIVSSSDGGWAAVRVQNQTQRDTVRAWYARVVGAGGRQHRSVPKAEGGAAGGAVQPLWPRVVDGDWGTNPTCKLYANRDPAAAAPAAAPQAPTP